MADAQFSGLARVPKTSERIAREIVDEIVAQELQEGTILPNEKQLIESFRVARGTVREALRLLETRGVITLRSGPGGGPVVRRPRADDLREALTLLLQVSAAPLDEVLEARLTLEPAMAFLAAERMTDEALHELESTIEVMRAEMADHDAFLRENQRFHAFIANATGNVVLSIFNETLKAIADGATVGVTYSHHRRRAVADAHDRIIAALRNGDGAAAEDAMRRHLVEAGDYWRRRYPELASRRVRWSH